MNKPNSTLIVPSEHQQSRMIIDYFGLSVTKKNIVSYQYSIELEDGSHTSNFQFSNYFSNKIRTVIALTNIWQLEPLKIIWYTYQLVCI